MKSTYEKQVDLLIDVLPFALADERFALKGGTAINLFHRDFPRLSVDIDLCYLPLEDRSTTFKNIHTILASIKTNLEKKLNLEVSTNVPLDGTKEAKLFVKNRDVEIKVEPNFTLRSSLFIPEEIKLSKSVEEYFQKSVKIKCLNIADVYGGKICAALDRQHPRDLFDVKFLFANEGITKDVKDSFLFYLLSHNRPIDELLNPNLKDITEIYKNEFVEMTNEKVELQELVEIRKKLITEINKSLTTSDKEFLITFVENRPDWNKVRDQKIKEYPSVKWKMANQEKMSSKKKADYLSKLYKILA
jgi:predicted nucleotidyltransferase component of viral defense system